MSKYSELQTAVEHMTFQNTDWTLFNLSNRYSGRWWVGLLLGAQKIIFLSISTWERLQFIQSLILLELNCVIHNIKLRVKEFN